jgi:hypothetical protein
MATSTNGSEEKAAAKAGGGRGPSYPAMGIEEAIQKAQQFWAAEKRSAAPIVAAARHWGYSETSSSGKVAVAALLHYGLLEDQGSKDSRTVKLSPRGLDIVLDAPDSPERLKAIQEAVRAPRLYADILTKWGAGELPSDQTMRYYLLRERGFNEGSVTGFLKDFRASVSFAKLDKPASITESTEAVEETDSVQATVDAGVTETARARVSASADSVSPKPGASSSLNAGEREWLRGPLSRAAGYRLIVSGDMGPKEIGKLIKLLEAQKAVLDDEDEEDA